MNIVELPALELQKIIATLPQTVIDVMPEARYTLAGGALRDILLDRPPRDYDVFPMDYVGEPYMVAENIQICSPNSLGCIELIKHFDFTVNAIGIWKGSDSWTGYCHSSTLADLTAKRLQILHFDPRSIFARTARMCGYGFSMPTSEFARAVGFIVKGAKGYEHTDLTALISGIKSAYGWTEENTFVSDERRAVRETQPLTREYNVFTVPNESQDFEEAFDGVGASACGSQSTEPHATPAF